MPATSSELAGFLPSFTLIMAGSNGDQLPVGKLVNLNLELTAGRTLLCSIVAKLSLKSAWMLAPANAGSTPLFCPSFLHQLWDHPAMQTPL